MRFCMKSRKYGLQGEQFLTALPGAPLVDLSRVYGKRSRGHAGKAFKDSEGNIVGPSTASRM